MAITLATVRPSDIVLKDQLTFTGSGFRKTELEIAAYYIVRYCQDHRAWVPFTYPDLLAAMATWRMIDPDFWDIFLRQLAERGFLMKEEETYSVLDTFLGAIQHSIRQQP